MEAVYDLQAWYGANRHLFDPPVCNKLMHKKQLSIMFVGGPNVRTDFHLDQGSEFFWMVKGNMELPTIQNGKRKVRFVGARTDDEAMWNAPRQSVGVAGSGLTMCVCVCVCLCAHVCGVISPFLFGGDAVKR